MLGQYWYHGLTRKYVSVFGTIFNDIYVLRKNSSGNVVETLKVPLVKKIGWTINMKKRNPTKPLPNWLIKAMSFNRVKF